MEFGYRRGGGGGGGGRGGILGQVGRSTRLPRESIQKHPDWESRTPAIPPENDWALSNWKGMITLPCRSMKPMRSFSRTAAIFSENPGLNGLFRIDPTWEKRGGMIMVPWWSMNPQRLPDLTAARPGEKGPAFSNCGAMTILPALSINPHFSSMKTGQRPSWNRMVEVNVGGIF